MTSPFQCNSDRIKLSEKSYGELEFGIIFRDPRIPHGKLAHMQLEIQVKYSLRLGAAGALFVEWSNSHTPGQSLADLRPQRALADARACKQYA